MNDLWLDKYWLTPHWNQIYQPHQILSEKFRIQTLIDEYEDLSTDLTWSSHSRLRFTQILEVLNASLAEWDRLSYIPVRGYKTNQWIYQGSKGRSRRYVGYPETPSLD